jgi:hypothetical protein
VDRAVGGRAVRRRHGEDGIRLLGPPGVAVTWCRRAASPSLSVRADALQAWNYWTVPDPIAR